MRKWIAGRRAGEVTSNGATAGLRRPVGVGVAGRMVAAARILGRSCNKSVQGVLGTFFRPEVLSIVFVSGLL